MSPAVTAMALIPRSWHASATSAAYSQKLRAVMGADAAHVSDFAYRYLTRERARAVRDDAEPRWIDMQELFHLARGEGGNRDH